MDLKSIIKITFSFGVEAREISGSSGQKITITFYKKQNKWSVLYVMELNFWLQAEGRMEGA